MIFENYKEYNSLINEIAKSIKHHQTKNLKDEDTEPTDEEESVGGDIPLDEVLPPSYGHESGTRVPNTTNKQTYHGGPWIEGELEDRLASLLEDIASTNDQTAVSQSNVHHGKVGIVPAIGHGDGEPGDPRKDDTYHKVKENRRKAAEERVEAAEDSEDMAKEMEELDLDDETDLPV